MAQQQFMESPIQELCRFRKSLSDPDNLEIPEIPQNRRQTNRAVLVSFITVVVVLVPFLVYNLSNADLSHWIKRDNCGNLCGYKNEKYEEWNCTGQDFTNKPYLLTRDINERICVEECPPGSYEFGYSSCVKIRDDNLAKDVKDAISGIGDGWWIIILSMLISVSLCFGMVLLFRHAVEFVVWFLLIGSMGVLAIAAGLFWIAYLNWTNEPGHTNDDQGASAFLTMAIVCSSVLIILLLLITCMIKRVKLVIQLFKESAKAIFEIPSLVYLPILTFIAVTLTVIIVVCLNLFTLTAAKLVEVAPNHLEYLPNAVMVFTMLYGIFVYVWFLTFIVGAQYIIVAGAVSAWFFTRNKNYLDSPLRTSFLNFLKFHLGTVLVGSLIITIVDILRMVLRGLAANSRTRWLVDCCCSQIIAFLKLFSKNAYIQTALHGQPFFESGKRAVKLFVSNVENVVALNSIGNFVIILAQLLLMVVCSAAGFFIAKVSGNPYWTAIGVICCFLAISMVSMFFNIFVATIDSIFMCYCEDTTLNDGMARPYFMSKGLRQFIENSKGIIPAKK